MSYSAVMRPTDVNPGSYLVEAAGLYRQPRRPRDSTKYIVLTITLMALLVIL